MSGSSWINGPFVSAPTTSATITGLSQGTSYDLRVTAVNATGPGGTSSTITRTTLSGFSPSPSGTTIPPAGTITADDGGLWTVVGGVIWLDPPGAAANAARTETNSVTLLLIHSDRRIYQENSANDWWYFDGTQSQPWIAVAGDPRVAPPPPPPPPPTGDAPALASAQGYNTRTFGPDLIFSGAGQNWLPSGDAGGPGTFSNNADGSVTIFAPSNAGDGNQRKTANFTGGYMGFTGRGFGGGMYLVARMKWANGAGINPAFWSNEIEGHTGYGIANTPVQWPGQSGDFNLWFEPDFMEADTNNFGSAMWQWFGSASNVQSRQPLAARTSVSDTNVYHDYGWLWVPATASNSGFTVNYVDGREYGRVNWPYRPNRNTMPGPPPTPGNDAGSNVTVPTMSDFDWRHIYLILGTAPGLPVTVLSVSIWQKDGTKNISA